MGQYRNSEADETGVNTLYSSQHFRNLLPSFQNIAEANISRYTYVCSQHFVEPDLDNAISHAVEETVIENTSDKSTSTYWE